MDDHVMFTLPPGDRPAHSLYLPIYTYTGTEGSLKIYSNGQVIPFGSNVSSYTGLDRISFAAGE